MFVQSRIVRDAGLAAYRTAIRFRPGRGSRIFLNSMPKAGTHLLINVLRAFPNVYFSGHHLHTYDYRTANSEPKSLAGFRLAREKLEARLHRIRPGHFVTAHFPYSDELGEVLSTLDYRLLYLYRDPCEVIVSEIRYTQRLRRHPLHEWINSFSDDVQLVEAIINGYVPPSVSVDRAPTPLHVKLATHVRWLEAPNCMTLRFEQLAGSAGEEAQRRAVSYLSSYIGRHMTSSDVANLIAKSRRMWSPTLRLDRKRSWTDELSPQAASLLRRACSDLRSTPQRS